MSALRNRGDEPEYSDVPWQRVLGHDGKIVIKGPGHGKIMQAELLEEEGVEVGPDLKVDMGRFLWEGLLPHEVQELVSSL